MKYIIAVAAFASLAVGASAGTIKTFENLNFETEARQSIWEPGDAVRYEGKKLLTEDINGSASIGAVLGNVNRTKVPTNPAWFLWEGCRIVSPDFICGDEPDRRERTVTVDTRTGAKASAEISGKIGAEVGYLLDGGSVGAAFEYNAQVVIPDDYTVEERETFRLNSSSTWESGMIDTQSPTAEAYVNSYLDLDVTVSGEACAIGFGCASGSDKIIDTGVQKQEIIGIDPNGITFLDGFVPGVEITAPLLNQTAEVQVGLSPPAVPKISVEFTETNPDGSPKLDENGQPKKTKIGTPIPVGISVDVASASIQFPVATGKGNLSGDKINLETESDFIKVFGDVDALVPILPPGGLNLDVGPLSVSATAYDLDVGPTIDVFQDFHVESKLFVDFTFDNKVFVAGQGLVSAWSGYWDELPDMAVFTKTKFSPVFSVVSTLANKTGLSFGFEAVAKLFELGVSVGLGPIQISGTLGPLFEKTFPLVQDFASISLYDKTFSLGGFGRVAGESFYITPAPVPLPAGLALLLSGLGALHVARRRRRTTTIAAAVQ